MEKLNGITIEEGEKIIKSSGLLESGIVSIKRNEIKISFLGVYNIAGYVSTIRRVFKTAEEAATYYNRIDTEVTEKEFEKIVKDGFELIDETKKIETSIETAKESEKDETVYEAPVEEIKVYDTAEEAATYYNRIGAYLSYSDLYYLIRGDEILDDDEIGDITIDEAEKVFSSPGTKNGKIKIEKNKITISFLDTGDGEEIEAEEEYEIPVEEKEIEITKIIPGSVVLERNEIRILFSNVYTEGGLEYTKTFETVSDAADYYKNIPIGLTEEKILNEGFELVY